MKNELNHIGTNTRVSIDKNGLYDDIPAKVDTGADTSSIWATNIKMVKNTLSFKLFGVGYSKYTGKIIKTNEFERLKIKNSFGVSEPRYKVKLTIIVGNMVIEDFFTLANRRNNTQPILLGKTFLRDRFVVDVSKGDILSNRAASVNKALVLTTRIDESVDAFYERVNNNLLANNISVDIVKFKDLRFDIIGKSVEVFIKDTPISNYSLVYIKNYKTALDQALAVANFCRYASIPFIEEELFETCLSISKLSEIIKLKTQRLPVIDSVISSNSYHIKSLDRYKKLFGFPLVIKDAFSDRGKNNYIVHNEKEFVDILSKIPKEAFPIVQKYIPNKGFYRIVLLDYKPKMVVYREVSPHKDPNKSHLNKPAGGINSKELSIDDLDEGTIKLVKRCSKIMKRNIAGIDLIKDSKTGSQYILEVNYNPSMVSGIRWREKADIFAEYINEKVVRRLK